MVYDNNNNKMHMDIDWSHSYEKKEGGGNAQPYSEEASPAPQASDSLREYGQISMPPPHKNPRGTIRCLNIIGQIEGHTVMPPANKTTKYEHVIPQLLDIAENPEIDGLLIILNTVGGDVEAGLAISELISHIGKPTVSLVIGGGHSIGVPLAVSAQYSYIAPSATMTIHPVRMNGTVIGAPQTYEYFNKTQERITDFIVRNSRITKTRLMQIMMDTEKLALDVGTILVGKEAVREGLINATGGLIDALETLYNLIAKDKRGKKHTKNEKAKEKSKPQKPTKHVSP